MAAPGYPNMPGHMGGPPMGGPPMGGPPMGGPPMGGTPQRMQPVRRGTSKAVPVVVSAGLAVGVFCGLLFGVGTGKEAGANAPSASNVKKVSEDEGKPDPGAAPKGLGATTAQPVDAPKPAAGSGSAAVAVATAGSGAGSAAPAAAGAGSAAKPAVAEVKKVIKVTLQVKPEGVMNDAKVKVNGKEIDGVSFDLPAETKSFKVEIKASGYRTYDNKFTAMPDVAEMKVDLELVKRPAAGTGTRPPKRPDRPTNAGGGGLIDI